jgi:pimeloyl-ACP methyl ester carboxylesterase
MKNYKIYLLVIIFVFALSIVEDPETAKQKTAFPDFYPQNVSQFKAYLNEHSRFITIDNVNVHYRDEGKGPVLILLHGFGSSLHTWEGWINVLKDRFRIIRMDIVGFGITGPSESGNYSTQLWIDFIHKFTNKLELDHFHLAGNSLGGYIAWNYTNQYPKKVDRLILIDSIGYPQEVPWIINFTSDFVLKASANMVFPKFMVSMFIKQVYHDRSLVSTALVNYYFGLAMRNINTYVKIFKKFKDKISDPNLGKDIKNIKVPVLLMWGKHDRHMPIECLDKWKKDLPDAISIVYEDAAHVTMEEIPGKTARDAYSFLMGSDCFISGQSYYYGKNGLIKTDSNCL